MKIITTIEEAQFLHDCPIISVDIETETAAPHKDWGAKFGLSFCAPITWISFYVKGFDPVAIQLTPENYNTVLTFAADVMFQKGKTLIAHNANFDLRSIGGHIKRPMPVDTKVWDTLTIGNLLMMGGRGGLSLQKLAERYDLTSPDKELFAESELAFMQRMKDVRSVLHLSDPTDVLNYVALDTIITWRLYEFQLAIVNCSDDVELSPYMVYEGTDWHIEHHKFDTSNHPFLHTKKWSKLPELIEWEQKISRWSANSAIRGVRFNKEWSRTHMENLIHSYNTELELVMGAYSNWLNADDYRTVMELAYYETLYDNACVGANTPPTEKFVYLPVRLERGVEPVFSQAWEDILSHVNDTQFVDEVSDYFGSYGTAPFPQPPAWAEQWRNEFGLVAVERYLPRPSVQRWFLEHKFKFNEDGDFLATVAARWYKHLATHRSEIDNEKLCNKPFFKIFYVFCVAGAPIPLDEDLVANSFLLSGELKDLLEDGNEADFIGMAKKGMKFSMGDDSLEFYRKSLFELDDEYVGELKKYNHPILSPFITVQAHSAKLHRIAEFWKHSERDGRIHNLPTRSTNTGRLASSQMNLQNLDMVVYKGYLVADDDRHVLIGLDVSNAENYFAAMTFGDSVLARACCAGDFHEEMARAYWGDELIDHLMKTDYDAYIKLRKRGKNITFGGAYGAGVAKISRMVGCTRDEAKYLLSSRDQRFPEYAEGKRKAAQRVQQCYNAGNRPAFTTLWSGRRVAIPQYIQKKKVILPDGTISETMKERLDDYKAVNYLQQGGVGELILRSQVLAEEEFERRGWDCHIPLQVHDEIIIHSPIEIAEEAAMVLCKIIYDVVPEEYRNRTVPAVRFLANLDKTNANKWGYDPLREYPLDQTKYVNAFGIWDLPEGADEAPVMMYHPTEGISIEDEIKQATVEEPKKVEMTYVETWKEFEHLLTRFKKAMKTFDKHDSLSELKVNDESKGLYDFPSRMVIFQYMAHNGQDPQGEYFDVLKQVDEFKLLCEDLLDWKKRNE